MKTQYGYNTTDMLTAIDSNEFKAGGSLDLLNDGKEDTITKINRFGCWQMDVGDLIEWAKK